MDLYMELVPNGRYMKRDSIEQTWIPAGAPPNSKRAAAKRLQCWFNIACGFAHSRVKARVQRRNNAQVHVASFFREAPGFAPARRRARKNRRYNAANRLNSWFRKAPKFSKARRRASIRRKQNDQGIEAASVGGLSISFGSPLHHFLQATGGSKVYTDRRTQATYDMSKYRVGPPETGKLSPNEKEKKMECDLVLILRSLMSLPAQVKPANGARVRSLSF